MCHGDDDGLRVPPRVAPKQVVIIPIVPKPELEEEVLAYAEKVKLQIASQKYYGERITVHVDKRDRRGGEKNWEWIKKGIPVRIEVGPRDIESGSVMLSRRDRGHKEKEKVTLDQLEGMMSDLLGEIQNNYFEQAKAFREMHIQRDIVTLEGLREFFTPKNPDKPEIHGGFVLAKWCEDPETEKILDEMKLTIRCLPLSQSGTKGKCILTGKEATKDVIIAKSY